MELRRALKESVEWPDLLGLALMSLAAPWVAVCIHSAWVFQRGTRLYNAELGGEFFRNGTSQLGVDTIFQWVSACAVPAIPTLLILLTCRKKALFRWLAWLGCIAFWTWICFKMEYAIK